MKLNSKRPKFYIGENISLHKPSHKNISIEQTKFIILPSFRLPTLNLHNKEDSKSQNLKRFLPRAHIVSFEKASYKVIKNISQTPKFHSLSPCFVSRRYLSQMRHNILK